MVVVAVDIVVIGSGVTVVVVVDSGGTVVREVVVGFCDPSAGGSSG